MTTSGDATACPREDDFVEGCRWVVAAHDSGDPQQLAAALCSTYRLLAARGWAPSKKAALLLHLEALDVAAELLQMVDVQQHRPHA